MHHHNYVVLTRKDTGKPTYVNKEKVETYNEDADGVGTCMILTSGTVRVFTESVTDVADKLRC